MSDPGFERRLGRMFSEAPAYPDADLFARGIEARLSRNWTVRRLLIGTAGLGGGVIAAVQMLGPHFAKAATGLSTASAEAFARTGQTIGNWRVLSELPIGGEVLWVGVGLAVLAVVLIAARSLEEF